MNTAHAARFGSAAGCIFALATLLYSCTPIGAQTRRSPDPAPKGSGTAAPQRQAPQRQTTQLQTPQHQTSQRQTPPRQAPSFPARRDSVTSDRVPVPPRVSDRAGSTNRSSIDASQGRGTIRADQRPSVTPRVQQRPNPATQRPRVDRPNPGQRNTGVGPGRTQPRTNDRIGQNGRIGRYGQVLRRPTQGNQAQRIFSRSREGRRYDSGLLLRRGQPVGQPWMNRYFPRGRYHYPYYDPSYNSISVVISPFGFYFGVCVPFLSRAHVHHFPPAVIYVEIPIYMGSESRGYEPARPSDNSLSWNEIVDREPGLANAIDDLRDTFRTGNVDALVTLIDPNFKIAVYLRGEYEYSLDPGDFVDLTRDALESTETISFDLFRIHERAAGVYVVSGEHVYRDRDGRSRTVYVSYVLEDLRGQWTLTQVGTAPDRIQEWR